MDPIIISKTEETPRINLDAEKNIFQFSDTSWPEDANKFYQPVLDWFEEYFKKPNPQTVIEFNLEYFNTASAKQIARLLTIIEKYSVDNDVTVKWYYHADDSDMEKAGSRYAKLLKIKFELIETND